MSDRARTLTANGTGDAPNNARERKREGVPVKVRSVMPLTQGPMQGPLRTCAVGRARARAAAAGGRAGGRSVGRSVARARGVELPGRVIERPKCFPRMYLRCGVRRGKEGRKSAVDLETNRDSARGEKAASGAHPARAEPRPHASASIPPSQARSWRVGWAEKPM